MRKIRYRSIPVSAILAAIAILTILLGILWEGLPPALLRAVNVVPLTVPQLFQQDLPGYKIARAGGQKPLPELPVIFLTANDLEEDVIDGFDLGADDYITKPFALL